MKKFLIATICFLSFNTALFAEENGVFVGVSYQLSPVDFKNEGGVGGQPMILNAFASNPAASGLTGLDTEKNNGWMNGAGLKIGYKQFFGQSKWFGLRYYAFLDYGYNNWGDGVLPDEKYHTHMFNYGVGIDTLWNIVNKENGSFGIFAGVNVGADTWIANGEDFQKTYLPNGKAAIYNFQTQLDLGFRTNFYKHNGLEIGIKIPFFKDQIFEDKNDSEGINTVTSAMRLPPNMLNLSSTTTLQRKYTLYVSYIYTF